MMPKTLRATTIALAALMICALAAGRMLARFPKARLADPDFVPVYGGAVGELRLKSLPMKIQ
jgi:hypothetical protein